MKEMLVKFTEAICNCLRLLKIISVVMRTGGENDTFTFFEGLNFISRQMKITLEYPLKFLFFLCFYSQHFTPHPTFLCVPLFFPWEKEEDEKTSKF